MEQCARSLGDWSHPVWDLHLRLDRASKSDQRVPQVLDDCCRWDAAGPFVSPYHIENVLFPLELLPKILPSWLVGTPQAKNIYGDSIAELASLTTLLRDRQGWGNPYIWFWFVTAGIGIASALYLIVRTRTLRVGPLLLLLAFLFVGYGAIRNWNHFALVVAITSCWMIELASAKPQVVVVEEDVEQDEDDDEDEPTSEDNPWPNILAWTLLLACCFLSFTGRWFLWTGEEREFGVGWARLFNAKDAFEKIDKENLADRYACIHMGHAGEGIYRLGPNRKVFFDGRLELHSRQTYEQHTRLEDRMRSRKDPVGWTQELLKLNCPVLVIDSEHNANTQAAVIGNRAWNLVYYDPVVAVFTHQSLSVPVSPVDFRARIFADSAAQLGPIPARTSMPLQLFYGASTAPDAAELLNERMANMVMSLGPTDELSVNERCKILISAQQQAQRAMRRRPWKPGTFRFSAVEWYLLARYLGTQPEKPVDEPAKLPVKLDATKHLLDAAAISMFQRTLAIDPNEFSANYYLALVFADLGAYHEAEQRLKLVLTREPQNAVQRKAAADAKTMLERVQQFVKRAGNQPSLTQLARLNEKQVPAPDLEGVLFARLLLGQPKLAGALLETTSGQGAMLPARRMVWESALAFAEGDIERSQTALESSPQRVGHAEPAFIECWVALLKGKREEFQFAYQRLHQQPAAAPLTNLMSLFAELAL